MVGQWEGCWWVGWSRTADGLPCCAFVACWPHPRSTPSRPHPQVYGWLGVEPPRGVLLHGPPGCGKTALANAIANECGVPFLRVSAPEVVSGMSGESEAKIRQLFQEAASLAPCIVFIGAAGAGMGQAAAGEGGHGRGRGRGRGVQALAAGPCLRTVPSAPAHPACRPADEIDAIAPKRETAQREMERRIVAQMLTCMDDLSSLYALPQPQPQGGESDGEAVAAADGVAAAAGAAAALLEGKHVVVIGATNRPDALDPALRRAGRFDREIAVGIPSEEARLKILQVSGRLGPRVAVVQALRSTQSAAKQARLRSARTHVCLSPPPRPAATRCWRAGCAWPATLTSGSWPSARRALWALTWRRS